MFSLNVAVIRSPRSRRRLFGSSTEHKRISTMLQRLFHEEMDVRPKMGVLCLSRAVAHRSNLSLILGGEETSSKGTGDVRPSEG